MKKIILASGSPRRSEMLRNIDIDFTVIKSDADESDVNPDGIPVSMYVQELALLKATEVYGRVAAENALIIGADTVVSIDGEILGKPADEADAFRMLKSLSGRTHQVYTGICVIRSDDGYSVCESECTDVTFGELSDDEIYEYIHTNEPFDKAGGYGIQGKGSLLIRKISGDYFNVVGLPVRKLVKLMKEEFNF